MNLSRWRDIYSDRAKIKGVGYEWLGMSDYNRVPSRK
nr:MAG TPA: hypothetical protein [Caudoviricetes sp.]